MLVSLLVGSAAQPAADPTSWLVYLGPFLPFGGLAVWVIISQQRQINARDERIKELSDRVVEQASQALPVLTKATEALESTARELRRSSER